jgi:20S proteasome subunit alpha 1
VRIRRRPAGSLDTPDTIRLAISALQHVLAADFQPEEVEVAVADASGFRKLTLEEIEEHLAAISERD